MADYDYLFKVLLVGDSGVGKSSLNLRFAKKAFKGSPLLTTPVDFEVGKLQIGDNRIKVQSWVLACQDRWREIRMPYYGGVHGALVIYDVTRKETFEAAAACLKELEENLSMRGIFDCATILVGNKCDLEHQRAVTSAEGAAFAAKNGMRFVETSALDATNVDEAFTQMLARAFIVRVLWGHGPGGAGRRPEGGAENGEFWGFPAESSKQTSRHTC